MKPLIFAILLAAAISGSACSKQESAPAATEPAPAPAAAAAPVLDQDALAALTRMGDYLRTLESFELTAQTTIDEVSDDGQKLQFDGTTTYRVRRPNAMFVETRTDRRHRQFFYDGAQFTVYAPRQHFYAQVDAPATIREVIDRVSERYDINLPLVDLFYWGTPEANTAAITSANSVGFARIGGVDTDQYAFRQEGVDWQVWIQRGERPLPRKLVITTRDGDANPQYSAVLDWNLNARFGDATFAFTPPPQARLIRINTAETTSTPQASN